MHQNYSFQKLEKKQKEEEKDFQVFKFQVLAKMKQISWINVSPDIAIIMFKKKNEYNHKILPQ